MRTVRATILLAAAMLMMSGAGVCLAGGKGEKEQKGTWSEYERGRGEHRRFELTEERIEHMMERIREANPERADELEKLREEDPEAFRAELRKTVRRHLQNRFRQCEQERPTRWGGGPFGSGYGPFGGMHRRGPKPPMRMHKEHAEYLEWLEENYPEEAEKLAELREERPELYRRKLAVSLKKYGRIAEASRDNPELAQVLKENLELKEQRNRLLRRIRTEQGEEKEALIRELQEVINVRYDLIVRRKQIEYERLRERLERLQREVERSEAEVDKWKDPDFKAENVRARLEELLDKTERFDWE